ncbi:MAG: helix-hairpin-helix domain-containing protein [Candidatus Competibacteraceae bacterium]
MHKSVKLITLFSALIIVLIDATGYVSYAAELQKFSNVKLIDHPANDGDSFFLEADGKTLHVRLYFVDCPENSASSTVDVQRIQEQARYFGLPDTRRIIYFGNEAKAFVQRILIEPFTLYTSFATAPGRSSQGRLYGFITTPAGEDLATLLVKNGLARTHGIGRETPDNIPRNEMIDRLSDLESAAMLKRIGIWAESDPEQIAQFRARQREEKRILQNLQAEIKKSQLSSKIIDINKASEAELQAIHGIGPVFASRIIAGRPYKNVDELLNVKGIGPVTLEKIRPYITVEQASQ